MSVFPCLSLVFFFTENVCDPHLAVAGVGHLSEALKSTINMVESEVT